MKDKKFQGKHAVTIASFYRMDLNEDSRPSALNALERNFLKLFGIILLAAVFYLPLLDCSLNWTHPLAFEVLL
jgi:hypothetical protein